LGVEDQLRILLQVYLAEYSLYAVLLLTGVLGALTVLLLWATTKKERTIFSVAYCILAAVSLFSFWRLIEYSRSVDVVLQRMSLIGLHTDIQGESAWAYGFFSWVFHNSAPILIFVILVGGLVFFLMWREIQTFTHATTEVQKQAHQEPSKGSQYAINDIKERNRGAGLSRYDELRDYSYSLVGSIVESFLSIFLSLSAILAALVAVRNYMPFSIKLVTTIVVFVLWGASIHFVVIYQFFQIVIRRTTASLVATVREVKAEEGSWLNRLVLRWVERVIFTRDTVIGVAPDIIAIVLLVTILFAACEFVIWF